MLINNVYVCQFSIKLKTVLKYTQKMHRYSMEFHKEQLLKCCRVCGRRLKTAKGVGRSFPCSSNSELLLDTFSIDVTQDDTDTHPPVYCFSCQGVIRRKTLADKKGVPYSTHATHILYQWYRHREGECKVQNKLLKRK